MDNVISFTPAGLVAFITAIGGAIVTIGAVITLIAKVVAKARQPEIDQDRRIKELEDGFKEHDNTLKKFETYFDNDDKRFKSIENANRITLETLLALLKHAIDGNDLKALEDAEKSLKGYLIDKSTKGEIL